MMKPLLPLLFGVALAQSPNIEDMLKDDSQSSNSLGNTMGNPPSNSGNGNGNQAGARNSRNGNGNQGVYQASPTGSGNANQGGKQAPASPFGRSNSNQGGNQAPAPAFGRSNDNQGFKPDPNIDYGNYAKFAKPGGKGNQGRNGKHGGNGQKGGKGNQDFYQLPSTGSGNAKQGKDKGPSPVNPATSIGGLMKQKSPAGMPGGMGGMMSAMTGAMGGAGGGKQDTRPDMFGRKPGQASPFGGMMGGGAGGGGGPAVHSKPNPLMDTLLDSIEDKMPTNKAQAAKNAKENPQISQESKLIVQGLIEQFMHKVELAPGEKTCLDHNLATLTADVVGTCEDIVRGVKAIIAGKKAHPGGGVHLSGKTQGTMVSAGLDGAMKLTSLATMSTTLMKNCVKGDALAMLKNTGKNMINFRYLAHRFLVSGVDIAHHLSAAINSYEAKDWKGFGSHIGVALRKVLLSTSESGSRLPEGVPEEAIIQETTQGLMSGFFTRGTGVEITDQQAPDVDIQLDLHRCIAGNHEFFKEAWLAMWNLIAQLSVNGAKHGLKSMEDLQSMFSTTNKDGSQPKWMGEMMIAMMQVPTALSRCNVGADTQQMMMEALKSMKFVRVHFLFPDHKMTGDEATKRMAGAVSAWTNWNFKEFGKQIGKLLREFVLLMYPVGNTQYPQMYSVDTNGRLSRQLNQKYRSSSDTIKVGSRSFSSTFVAFSVGGFALTMLVALVAVRGLRVMSRESYRDPYSSDAEGSLDGDMEGNFLEVE